MARWKLFFHIKFWFFYLLSVFFGYRITRDKSKKHLLKKRINYYIKLNKGFHVASGFSLSEIPKFKPNSAYFYDFYKILSYFSSKIKFNFILGDINFTPSTPTFVKARPINGFNNNSILLPLNTWRHFLFINDDMPYEKKISKIIWRGAAYQNIRKNFLKKTFYLPFCDVGCTARGHTNNIYKKRFMSIKEQLKFKFIFSVEGNDVASNLKWILNSNSLCFMQKPKIETWAMEGLLKPGIHYVEINSNFSNLEAEFFYYLNNPQRAKKIIRNANKFISQIKDKNLQFNIAIGVVEKYLSLSGQSKYEF